MDTLLEQLNDYIGEKTKKPRKTKFYTPTKAKIDQIGKVVSIDSSIYYFVNDLLTRKTWKEEILFNAFTGIDYEKIDNMSEKTREKIRTKIKEVMDKIEPGINLFNHIFNEKTQRYKNRVRAITEGKKVEDYYWITKEEEKEYFSYYKNIAYLSLERSLGFENENFDEKILENVLNILGRKEMEKRFYIDFLTESTLKMQFKSRKFEKLKEMAHNWYQTSDKSIFQERDRLSSSYEVESRLFLLNENEIKELQEIFLLKYEKEFRSIKSLVHRDVGRAKTIRSSVIRVLEWGI